MSNAKRKSEFPGESLAEKIKKAQQELKQDVSEKEKGNVSTEKSDAIKAEIPKNLNQEKPESKQVFFQKYEMRVDEDLDTRFRRYKFEARARTNETIKKALDFFLEQEGY